MSAAVRVGFHPQVEVSRLRSHLGYLVTTVVSLHVAAYCWLISAPTRHHAPHASPQAVHMRVATKVVHKAGPASATAVGESQPDGGSAPYAAMTANGPNTFDEHRAAAMQGLAGAPSAGGTDTVPAEPEAAEILARAEVPEPIDDGTLLADLKAQQAMPGEGTDGANEYLPRSELTQGPQATGAVVIDFPLHVGQLGHFSTVLALFIDEAGTVRRIRVDGAPLPEAFEDAARQSFLRTRFRPGHLNGQVVKSLIRVEVVFDSTSLDVAHGVKSLSLAL